jgi:hypothetical protein
MKEEINRLKMENSKRDNDQTENIRKKTKEMSSLCAKERNEYSEKEIHRDFKAGLLVGCISQDWDMGRVYRSRPGYG